MVSSATFAPPDQPPPKSRNWQAGSVLHSRQGVGTEGGIAGGPDYGNKQIAGAGWVRPSYASAASTASPNRSTIVSTSAALTIYGGARITWSPILPSIVPPI